MEKLSRMQQRVYDYIAESIAEHGYAPSVREVGEANAAIFEMQKELLENQEYTDFIMKRILEEKLNAEYIVQTSVEQLIRISSHQQNNPIQANKNMSEKLKLV